MRSTTLCFSIAASPSLSSRPRCVRNKCQNAVRCTPRCAATPLPATYTELEAQAIGAVQAALSAGEKLVEVQFPAVPNIATAALNELLDANRAFTRSFLLSFTPRYPPGTVTAVFPDAGEARLARAAYGDTPFNVAALPRDGRAPAYMEEEGLLAVVNPGFNVGEWINMEALDGGRVVTVNADLDKVRGGYYPRVLYPGLFGVKTRFLKRFVGAYYVKMFAGGGVLMRCFPEPWTVWCAGEVVWSGHERPALADVQRMLTKRQAADAQKRLD